MADAEKALGFLMLTIFALVAAAILYYSKDWGND